MPVKANQIRAARALKNWSQSDLAELSGLAVPTIANIEAGKQHPSTKTIDAIIQTFTNAGIEFIEQRGVKKSTSDVQLYHDTEGFRSFLDDLYEIARTKGGEISLFNAAPKNWLKWIGEDWWFNVHAPRMEKVKGNVTYRLTCKEGETQFMSRSFGRYRWIPKHLFNEDAAFYVYGSSVAFINFQPNSVTITAIHQPQVTMALKILFQSAWDNLTIDTPEH